MKLRNLLNHFHQKWSIGKSVCTAQCSISSTKIYENGLLLKSGDQQILHKLSDITLDVCSKDTIERLVLLFWIDY